MPTPRRWLNFPTHTKLCPQAKVPLRRNNFYEQREQTRTLNGTFGASDWRRMPEAPSHCVKKQQQTLAHPSQCLLLAEFLRAQALS